MSIPEILTSAPVLAPDAGAAVAFLQRARPTGFWVLVAIDPELPGGSEGKIETRSFGAREAAGARAWIESRNARRLNIYWTVNAVARPLAKKPAREDIDRLEWLHVDVDPDKHLPLDQERARLEQLFGDAWPTGIPPATVVIDSGGGLQGFWRLSEPLPLGGAPEAYEDAARYNQQLEIRFGGDGCHNVDRIMRLPGTINWPDARKRAAGRVPRLAAVWTERDVSYPLTAFTPAPIRQTGATVDLTPPRARVDTGNVERLLSLDELPDKVSGLVKVVINTGGDPDNPRRWPSRSEPLFWICCELVAAAVPDDVIYSIITDPDFGISASVLDKGARAEDYALRQIQQAHEERDDPILAGLNKRHAVIGNVGGKCRILCEDVDPDSGRAFLSYQTFDDFKNRYANQHVAVDEKRVPLGYWWVTHERRRTLERVVFAPGRDVPGAYNLWRGFACEAIPGDCSLYLQHVRDNICRGDEQLLDYVLSWAAAAVQHPDQPGHTALVLRGPRGAGKGVFAQGLGSLFGRHFMQVVNPAQLFGQFNYHLKDCVLLFADETFYAGDKRHEAVLKGLVTERQIVTEAKYQAAEMSHNCLHIVMAANNDWVVPAGPHERRFLVLDVAANNLQDLAYFGAIEAQMSAGGREALLHLLLTRDLSGYDPRAVPRTAALQEQKEHSLTIEEDWWHAKLRAGEIRDGAGWPEWIACSELAWDFSRYAERWGRGQRLGAARVGRMLERLGAERRQLGRRVEVITESGEPCWMDRPRIWRLPTLEESRRAWEKRMGGEFVWGAEILDDPAPEEPYA